MYGKAFGGKFAEHEGQISDHQRESDRGDGRRGLHVEAGRDQNRRDRRRNRGRSVRGGCEAGHGHANLNGCQKPVGIARQSRDPLAAFPASSDRVDLTLTEGYEGHFGGGEDATYYDEDDDQTDIDGEIAVHEVAVVGRGVPGAIRALGLWQSGEERLAVLYMGGDYRRGLRDCPAGCVHRRVMLVTGRGSCAAHATEAVGGQY